MPDPNPPSERTAAERQADHDGLARLSEALVPALVAKLNASALAELEVREGDWRIRLRRPPVATHRRERVRATTPGERRGPTTASNAATSGARVDGEAGDGGRAIATSPAVGVFRSVATVGARVRAGDRIAVVDLLGIAQDVNAPIDGVLVEVFAETGEAVEYGEELAALEPVDDGAPARDGTDDGKR